MKKLFLVLALVATYGVSMAMSSSNVNTVDNAEIAIVADVNDSEVVAPEGEKEKAATTETKAAKSEGCAGTKTAATSTAKSEGCGGTAKAADCSGDKTKTASTTTTSKKGSK